MMSSSRFQHLASRGSICNSDAWLTSSALAVGGSLARQSRSDRVKDGIIGKPIMAMAAGYFSAGTSGFGATDRTALSSANLPLP
jgi:hypothetical protein